MKILIFFLVLNLPILLFSQQVADTTYNPIIPNPEYEFGEGPVIFKTKDILTFTQKMEGIWHLHDYSKEMVIMYNQLKVNLKFRNC